MTSLTQDFSFDLTYEIFDKTRELGLKPSSLMLNFVINSSVSANEIEKMFSLLMLATVMDYKVDLNTYWRLCFRLYDGFMPITVPGSEVPLAQDQKGELLFQLFTMLDNDHGTANLEFSSKIIQDYYNTVISATKD